MDESAQPGYERRAMPGLPDPDHTEEPDGTEQIADADLDALDAMAEALLEAVVQGRSDDDLPPVTPPASDREGTGPPPSAAS
jgi:hypothetical protein